MYVCVVEMHLALMFMYVLYSPCIQILCHPVIVIEVLDGMKKGKENYTAREAIKFLERELQSGNQFIRAQKAGETLQSGRRKPPKQDLQTWWVLL